MSLGVRTNLKASADVESEVAKLGFRRVATKVVPTASDAAVTAPAEAPAKNAGERATRSLIGDEEQKIAEVSARIESNRARRAKLEEERSQSLPAARLQNSQQARAAVDRLREEAAALDRDIRDDEEALADAQRILAGYREELARADWNSRRDAIRRKLQARQAGDKERQLVAAVAEVKRLSGEILLQDKEIAEELLAFDSSLKSEYRAIATMERLRSDLVACQLSDLIEVRLSGAYIQSLSRTDMESQMRSVVGRVINAVDCMAD